MDHRPKVPGIDRPIVPGTILTTRAYSPNNAEFLQRCLVCNYHGNGIANAFVISKQPRPNSRIVVEVPGHDGPITVLTHQVRSVDLAERVISVDHAVGPWEVIAVQAVSWI